MTEYETFQNNVPYNTFKDVEFLDACFTHKENFALAQAAFYIAIGEFRKAQVIMKNTNNFSSKEHGQIAWLVLTASIRKAQKQEEVLFGPYLIPTLSYFNGAGELDKVKDIINTLSREEQSETRDLLEKASNPAYYHDPKIIINKHLKHKHRRR